MHQESSALNIIVKNVSSFMSGKHQVASKTANLLAGIIFLGAMITGCDQRDLGIMFNQCVVDRFE